MQLLTCRLQLQRLTENGAEVGASLVVLFNPETPSSAGAGKGLSWQILVSVTENSSCCGNLVGKVLEIVDLPPSLPFFPVNNVTGVTFVSAPRH